MRALFLVSAATIAVGSLSGISAFAQQTPAVRTNQGFLATSLPRNDDESTTIAVPIGFTINFFGSNYSSFFVNNNGNVTFTGPLADFTPEGLTESDIPIIAPFWADVDTRGAASSLVTYGRDTVNSRAAFGVNWVNVGYYSEHTDKLNSFQLVLIDRSDTGNGNFDIEFNYNRIVWETGDASDGENGLGGFSASVGYSNGSTLPGTFVSIPGSLTPGAFLDSNSTGLIRRTQPVGGVLGRLVFAVRSGRPDPTISSIAPNMIAPGSPQFQMQVNGANFVTGSTVQWLPDATSVVPLATTFQNAGVLQATVPASLVATSRTVQVRVVNPAPAVNPSSSVPFTIASPVPVVTGISPLSASAGATVSATVSGSNLTGATAVAFSGSGVTATIGQGGTATTLPITITIAANAAPGSRTLTVTTGSLVSTAFSGFTVIPSPTISSISPNTIAAGSPQFQVQVNGTGFVDGSTVQWLGGVPGIFLLGTTFQNASTLQATVPASLLTTAYTATVTVINPGMQGNPASSVPFTITPSVPVVTGIGPPSGLVGTTVSATVSGSNLTGATAVSFSGSGVTATIASGGTATSLPINITIAANAALGLRTLTVTNGSGVSSVFSGFTVALVQAPAITLTGLTATPFPTQAATVGVGLSSAATSPLVGTLTLTFQPNAGAVSPGYIDPALQFANGGRSLDFTAPTGASTVTLPQNGLIQQGTVAGTITVSLTALSSGGTNLLPANPPTRSIVVSGLPPVIYANTLQITNKSESGFNVEFNAYSTTRDLTSVTFAFSPASGATLNGTTSFTVPLESIGPQWFGSPTGLSSGAAFHLVTPFTISGDSSAIGTVSVTLTNSIGNSATQTVGF